MSTKGDWSDHDNKKYVGKLDRIYVSMTEKWEVEYFIDHWLETRGHPVNNNNRDVITQSLEDYKGPAPYKRENLNDYLDKKHESAPKA